MLLQYYYLPFSGLSGEKSSHSKESCDKSLEDSRLMAMYGGGAITVALTKSLRNFFRKKGERENVMDGKKGTPLTKKNKTMDLPLLHPSLSSHSSGEVLLGPERSLESLYTQ